MKGWSTEEVKEKPSSSLERNESGRNGTMLEKACGEDGGRGPGQVQGVPILDGSTLSHNLPPTTQ